jgi:hypothetical protein
MVPHLGEILFLFGGDVTSSSGDVTITYGGSTAQAVGDCTVPATGDDTPVGVGGDETPFVSNVQLVSNLRL